MTNKEYISYLLTPPFNDSHKSRMNMSMIKIRYTKYKICEFFSYSTPVASYYEYNGDKFWLVTSSHYSVTTTKHVNMFCKELERRGYKYVKVDSDFVLVDIEQIIDRIASIYKRIQTKIIDESAPVDKIESSVHDFLKNYNTLSEVINLPDLDFSLFKPFMNE